MQHADDDHAWQREAPGLMEAQVPRNEVRKADIAYLRDRLDVADGLQQRYGTQGGCAAKGTWAPAKIDEPKGSMRAGGRWTWGRSTPASPGRAISCARIVCRHEPAPAQPLVDAADAYLGQAPAVTVRDF